MKSRMFLGLAIAVAVGISALAYVDRTLAQPVAQTPMGPGGQMMGPGQQMPMGQMLQQMTRMTANLQTRMGMAQGVMRQMPGMGR